MRAVFGIYAGFAAWLVLFVLGSLAPALAAPMRVRLEHQRDEQSARCPDAAALRVRVAARLGYDPFVDDAGRVIQSVITRAEAGYRAELVIADENGKVSGRRTLVSSHEDCAELEQAMALALSLAIDPFAHARAQPQPVAEEPARASAPIVESPAAPVLAQDEPLVPKPRNLPNAFPVAASAVAGLGLTPGIGFGVAVDARARWKRFMLGVEGRALLPSSEDVASGRVTGSLLTGSVLSCLRHGIFAACMVVSAGALRVAGEGLTDSRRLTFTFASIGFRAEADVPIGDTFFVRGFLEGSVPFSRNTVLVDDEPAWTSSAVGGTLGLGVGARF